MYARKIEWDVRLPIHNNRNTSSGKNNFISQNRDVSSGQENTCLSDQDAVPANKRPQKLPSIGETQ